MHLYIQICNVKNHETCSNTSTCVLDGNWMSRVSAQMGGKARVQQAGNKGRKWLQIENSEQSTKEAIRSKWKEIERHTLKMMEDVEEGKRRKVVEERKMARNRRRKRKTSSKPGLPSLPIKYLANGIRDHMEMISRSLWPLLDKEVHQYPSGKNPLQASVYLCLCVQMYDCTSKSKVVHTIYHTDVFLTYIESRLTPSNTHFSLTGT